MEKSKTKMSDLKVSGTTKQPRSLGNQKNKTDLKRKMGFEKNPKTKFFELLGTEMGGRVPAAEEDLKTERRLAKKLKLRNGKLGASDDGMDMLLEGVPDLDDLAEIEKGGNNAETGVFPRRRKKINFVDDDDSQDEISVDEESGSLDSSEDEDEGDGESELLASSEEHDEESDLLVSSEGKEEDEESDSLVNSEEKDERHEESEKSLDKSTSHNNSKDSSTEPSQKTETKGLGKYVAPHLRSHGGSESAEYAEVRKRVRGMHLLLHVWALYSCTDFLPSLDYDAIISIDFNSIIFRTSK